MFIFLITPIISFSALFAQEPHIPGFYGGQANLAPPAANTLPQIQGIVSGVDGLEQRSDKHLVVHQNESKAILDWSSFDIGIDAQVHFDQQGNADWAALNRIFDQNPSQIYGKLTADGKVYLINPNGMLFSGSARINMHTLAASALKITEADFKAGTLRFVAENPSSEAVVANHGLLETKDGGAVLLMGPKVENNGAILAPKGDVNIAGGDQAEYNVKIGNTGEEIKTFTVSQTGTIHHMEGGRIVADGGGIRMFAEVVNTDGLIRSISAFNSQGTIELRAADHLRTGPQGVITTPVSDSEEAFHESFQYAPGEILLEAGRLVELNGEISAPGGKVSISATGTGGVEEQNDPRIYLAEGSAIDVGGSWVDKAAEEQIIEFQLNTVELRDDYGQKESDLKGQDIVFNQNLGSAIGNVESHLSKEETTAAERTTGGGLIEMTVPEGDIIIRSGAFLDISGGGFSYQNGTVATTKLVSNKRIYDISDAPQFISYDKLLGTYEKINERFGVIEKYEGLHYGGAVPLKDYVANYRVGSNAGNLDVIARHTVFDGNLDASVTTGIYQTETGEVQDELGFALTRDRAMPVGGGLNIGKGTNFSRTSYQTADPIAHEIAVHKDTQSLPSSFGPQTSLTDIYSDASNPYLSDFQSDAQTGFRTLLSASNLRAAGLSNINLYATTQLSIEPDTHLMLPGGAKFLGTARRIVHQGQLVIPSGSVKFLTASNYTSDALIGGLPNTNYISLDRLGPERIHLAEDSRIDVGGERIDSLKLIRDDQPLRQGRIDGGTIELQDFANQGQGIVLEKNAVLDVRGGHQIDLNGKVAGGDGGVLSMAATALILDGRLLGHSIEGFEGGRLNLQAQTIQLIPNDPEMALPNGLSPSDPLPENLLGKLTLAHNRLEPTGFTHLSLTSLADLVLSSGIVLTPSNAKRTTPLPASGDDATSNFVNRRDLSSKASIDPKEGIYFVEDPYLGNSSLSIRTGQLLGEDLDFKEYAGGNEANLPFIDSAKIVLSDNALVEAPLGGGLSLSAPAAINVSGTLRADAGKINLETTNAGSVQLMPGGRLLTPGFNRVEPTTRYDGLQADITVYDGGTVEVVADTLLFDKGSVIDVSAAGAAKRFITRENRRLQQLTIAGHAGAVHLSYLNASDQEGASTLNGEIIATHADIPGISGGGLFLEKRIGDLQMSNLDLGRLLRNGIGSLSLNAADEIIFDDIDYQLKLKRHLLLDARRITIADSVDGANPTVRFSAPMITLQNSSFGKAFSPTGSKANLEVFGEQGIELKGQLSLEGFGDVSLKTRGDMQLEELQISTSFIGGEVKWLGGLETEGNLLLTADRIYPTTLSRFTIRVHDSSGSLNGKLSINGTPNNSGAPVLSAGGLLVLAAHDIKNHGVIKAPMGSVVYCGDFTKEQVEGKEVFNFERAMGEILLGSESITSTAGEAPVYFDDITGLQEGSLAWRYIDHATNLAVNVKAAPVGSVAVLADTVIDAAGSQIDAAGGGEVFSYRFDPGIEGSFNPLTRSGRKVLLPNNPAVKFGESIKITSSDFLADGEYVLLDEQFAFMPGALILEDRGILKSFTQAGELSEEGHQQVVGYYGEAGSDVHNPNPHLFTVRPASEVLQEGFFQKRSFVYGDGGTVKLSGDKTVLNGRLNISALPGFNVGTLDAGGTRVEIVKGIVEEKENALVLSAEGLLVNDQGILKLGDKIATTELALKAGAHLKATEVVLSASNRVAIESGATVESAGTAGRISLNSPEGEIEIAENALLHAGNEVELNSSRLTLQGEIDIDNSHLTLSADGIWLVPDTFADINSDGLYLTRQKWDQLADYKFIELKSSKGLTLVDDINLHADGRLIIDTGWIASQNTAGSTSNQIAAGQITLLNSFGESADQTALTDSGDLSLFADTIVVGQGDITIDGYQTVTLNAMVDPPVGGEIKLQGIGSLTTDANLNLNSGRITQAAQISEDADGVLNYQAADFRVKTTGHITMGGNGQVAGAAGSYGGKLLFQGENLSLTGLVEAPAATITLKSVGSTSADSIRLNNGARILADGSGYFAPGQIFLESTDGGIQVDNGSELSVTAGQQGDAGTLSISAHKGGVSLSGNVSGSAGDYGRGGSFAMDTQSAADLASITQTLVQGGFTRYISIRSRKGDTLLPDSAGIQADHIKLSADGGDLVIRGTISTSSAAEGGLIELNAGENLILEGATRILATSDAADAKGGEVYLNAGAGEIDFGSNANIDVTNDAFDAEGGIVYFRAKRAGNRLNMKLEGSITGAAQIVAEGYELITDVDTIENAPGSTLPSGVVSQQDVTASAAAFINNLDWDTRSLDSGGAPLTVIPGVEIHSKIPDVENNVSGNLDVTDQWTLTGERFGQDLVSGALTLRAAGSLSIKGSLIDRPTSLFKDLSDASSHSIKTWSIRLTSGADLDAADPMAVAAYGETATGKMMIENNLLIYTESAPIWLASAADTVIGNGMFVEYISNEKIISTLMTFDKPIRGQVGGNLTINGGAIQSATGNIDIAVGGNLNLQIRSYTDESGDGHKHVGSIRTVGQPPPPEDIFDQFFGYHLDNYWEYDNGGDLTLKIKGNIGSKSLREGWGEKYRFVNDDGNITSEWAAAFGSTTALGIVHPGEVSQGVVAQAGGDIIVRTGGDLYAPIGNFGEGNVQIATGGDLEGRFLVTQGIGRLTAMQNFGRRDDASSFERMASQLELFDAQMTVAAQANLYAASIINPGVAAEEFSGQKLWNLGYAQQTAISLQTLTGDITYSGKSEFTDSDARIILPPTLEMTSGRDILLQNPFAMPPAKYGQLELHATRNIDGEYIESSFEKNSSIVMSDAEPRRLYGMQTDNVGDILNIFSVATQDANHASKAVHTGDAQPIRITAGQDIADIKLILPKKTYVEATRDIADFQLQAQTIEQSDQNFIYAGRDLILQPVGAESGGIGIDSMGPGGLVVQAANRIDLGVTSGIQASGATANPSLDDGDGPLLVISGIAARLEVESVAAEFEALRDAGIEYSEALANGDMATADQIVADARERIITNLIPAENHGKGDIEMESSQIATQTNPSDLFIIATGDINVGKSALSSGVGDQNTGIYTTSGGNVNIFAVDDINVNESRIVTFAGGDIVAWTDYGNLNAGRGSKAAISASPPSLKITYVLDSDGNPVLDDNNFPKVDSVERIFNPPAVGSGIRALTFDPDGESGSQKAPEIGDIFLFAPEGEIDAGEAGIAGKNIFLGAQRVVNVQNIEVGGTSVGVPSSTNTGAIGITGDTGSLKQANELAAEAQDLASKKQMEAAAAAQLAEALKLKWLKVDFVGYDERYDEEK